MQDQKPVKDSFTLNQLYSVSFLRLFISWFIIYVLPTPLWSRVLLVLLSDNIDCDTLWLSSSMSIPKKELCGRSLAYQSVDKITDTLVYTMLLPELKRELPQYFDIFLFLFLFRTAGVGLFEYTSNPQWLVVFPDFFGWFALIAVSFQAFGFKSARLLTAALLVAGIVKVYMETRMHWYQTLR